MQKSTIQHSSNGQGAKSEDLRRQKAPRPCRWSNGLHEQDASVSRTQPCASRADLPTRNHKLCGQCIYYREQAINVCDDYVRAKSCTLERTIALQQFSSASKKQTMANKFVDKQGVKLTGSMFVIEFSKAKEIDLRSVLPEEQKMLCGM